MDFIDKIKSDIQDKGVSLELTRKFFLSYKGFIFKDKEDLEFDIINSIKKEFGVDFLNIQFSGSSKTGFSFFKKTLFTLGESDLDISIINLDIYNKFLEIAHRESKSFSDLSVFPVFNGNSSEKQFIKNLRKGFINPYYMPLCKERSEWLDIFRIISNKHISIFKSINGCIYASEYFFESKQIECLEEFERSMNSYDTLSSKV